MSKNNKTNSFPSFGVSHLWKMIGRAAVSLRKKNSSQFLGRFSDTSVKLDLASSMGKTNLKKVDGVCTNRFGRI